MRCRHTGASVARRIYRAARRGRALQDHCLIAFRGDVMNEPIWRVLEHKGHEVECVAPSATVLAAVRRMNDCRIGALLVTDGHRPIGIFTERDILVRVIARGLAPETTPVGEVMTRNPISIRSDA